jgi:NAD(P)H-hydrate epimerase
LKRNFFGRALLTDRAQSLELDHISQNKFNLSGLDLMNRAGRKVFEYMESRILPCLPLDSVLIMCGPGNNGGDGAVVAREMLDRGITRVHLWTVGKPSSEFLKTQLTTFPAFQVELQEFTGSAAQLAFMEKQTLIIDAIFGVGLNREVEDLFKIAIDACNDSLQPILSIDTPSGLNVDTGRVMGSCIEAQWTVTFGASKPGFYIWDGPRCTGEVSLHDIGFPDEALEEVAKTHFLFDHFTAAKLIPKRSDVSNKSKNGRVVLFAGKTEMWGAAILASKAAFRAGAGYVEHLSFDDPAMVTQAVPDVISRKADESFDPDPKHTYVVGPGLGVGKETEDLIQKLLSKNCESVVLDADAITTLATMEIKKLPSTWFLTPHSGELSRLLSMSSIEIDYDRFAAAKICYEKYGCGILLKGYKTIVGDNFGFEVINSGNSALATAGTGDVLAGLIGGLRAQGLSMRDAVGLGAYLHGTTADHWVKMGNAKNSMMASDILDLLPKSFQHVLDYEEE